MNVHESTVPAVHQSMRTACEREIVVGRLAFSGPQHPHGRVTLDVGLRPYDSGEAWVSLTPAESRLLAGHLLAQATAVERDGAPVAGPIEVSHAGGEAYAITIRQHPLLVDQPADAHGDDSAATPTELFVASLASCVAFYAGRFLHRHDLPRDGLRVTAEFVMATDRPARVDTVRLRVSAPGLPEERREALRAVASHCTVHNTLQRPPEVTIELS